MPNRTCWIPACDSIKVPALNPLPPVVLTTLQVLYGKKILVCTVHVHVQGQLLWRRKKTNHSSLLRPTCICLLSPNFRAQYSCKHDSHAIIFIKSRRSERWSDRNLSPWLLQIDFISKSYHTSSWIVNQSNKLTP